MFGVDIQTQSKVRVKQQFWKWCCRKSRGICLWQQFTCTWNLKLKFQIKLALCSGNPVTYGQTDALGESSIHLQFVGWEYKKEHAQVINVLSECFHKHIGGYWQWDCHIAIAGLLWSVNTYISAVCMSLTNQIMSESFIQPNPGYKLKCQFVYEKFHILNEISAKLVPKGPIDHNPALV